MKYFRVKHIKKMANGRKRKWSLILSWFLMKKDSVPERRIVFVVVDKCLMCTSVACRSPWCAYASRYFSCGGLSGRASGSLRGRTLSWSSSRHGHRTSRSCILRTDKSIIYSLLFCYFHVLNVSKRYCRKNVVVLKFS